MNLASWIQRVGAYIVDFIPFAVLVGIGTAVAGPSVNADGTASGGGIVYYLFYLLGIAWLAYDRWFLGGQGASWGKKLLGLKLVKEQTGQPIGFGLAFVRDLLHVLDSICLIGYLFPLWDAKKQTFSDKILGTVVPKA